MSLRDLANSLIPLTNSKDILKEQVGLNLTTKTSQVRTRSFGSVEDLCITSEKDKDEEMNIHDWLKKSQKMEK